MEQKNNYEKIQEKIRANKKKALEVHEEFFSAIDQIASKRKIIKQLIEESDTFINKNGIDVNNIAIFCLSQKVDNCFSDILSMMKF